MLNFSNTVKEIIENYYKTIIESAGTIQVDKNGFINKDLINLVNEI